LRNTSWKTRLSLGGATAVAALLITACGGYGGGNGGGGGGSAPAAPTGLVATPGNTTVNLSWAATSGATGYYVKRSTTSGAESKISTQPGTSFSDTGLTNGTKYFYVVSAYNSYGESADSSEVSATPTAAPIAGTAPTALIATPGNSQVVLNWNLVADASSYNLKRSTTSGGPYSSTVGTPSANSFVDTSVSNGTKYFYVVTAVSSSGESANSPEASATPATVVAADVTVTANPASTKSISPYIYGTNFYSGNSNPAAALTLDRAGGNRWTAYNWINNGSNAGADYHYENDDYLCNGTCNAGIPAEAVRTLVAADQTAGLASLVTLQMQGWVSIDTTTVQLSPPFTIPDTAHFRPTVDKKSTTSAQAFTLSPPAASVDNNVYIDEFAWALDQKFLGQNIFGSGASHPTFISLDNEPDLWFSTHPEIQGPTNPSTAAFITKTINFATALKDLKTNSQTPSGHFSNVVIFGPVNYGFNGIYSWQGDPTLGPTPNGSDWFADKYLDGIKAASATYGAPLVDVYDFHWYSEATDGTTRVTNMTGTTLTDAQIQAIVQSPRSLWDNTYAENSWITGVLGGPIYILRRLENKIQLKNPGMKIAITEYENGGFNHIAGTIAQADNIGIFGSEGVFAANFWPPNGTYDYTMAGFRAYRNFDGAGANFGDVSVSSASSDVSKVAVYMSQDTTTPGRIAFVALNRTNTPLTVTISGQTLSGLAHIYLMTATTASGQSIVQPVPMGTMAVGGSTITLTLPALSVTTIEVK